MKRGKYFKEDFTNAVYEYKNGYTTAEVNAKYNIPGSTIRHHKLNPELKISGGRPSILTKDQEQYLVELLKKSRNKRPLFNKLVVVKLAAEYVELVTDICMYI